MLLSIPFYRCGRSSGVERNLAKVDVEGPNPFARSIQKAAFFKAAFFCGRRFSLVYRQSMGQEEKFSLLI